VKKVKKENELEAWRKAWPGIVSKNVTGDAVVATSFNGEAKALMYEVKNAVRLGNLNQLSRTRRYPDGTVIRAVSTFGNDAIFIDTTNSIFNATSCLCSITLIDVPFEVAPMMHPSHIHVYGDDFPEGVYGPWRSKWGVSEIEGVGYHKTYYTRTGCGSLPLKWN
jgi:hypothetical protein